MRLLDGHHGKDVNFLFPPMDAVGCRERAANAEPVRVFPPVNVPALPVAPVAGKRVFLEGFEFFHNYSPALFAEAPDTLKGLAVNHIVCI